MATRARSRPRLVLHLIAAGAAAAGLALCASSCSLIVNSDSDQCATQADCAAFPGTLCQSGLCAACSTTADCIGGYGDFNVCRKDTHLCAPLLSAQCQEVIGNYKDDNAVILGAISPLVGSDASTGLSLVDSVKLALTDLDLVGDLLPLPGSNAPRPLVIVSCDDSSDSATGQLSATHLANEVGVPAILGPAFSSVTIDVANNVTIPAGVLLFSPSATSTEITSLTDHGLVWRTSPSDIYQAAAIKQYVPRLEAEVRMTLGLSASDPIKLAMIYKGDSYGTGLASAVTGKPALQFNGSSCQSPANANNFINLDYGDPSHPMGRNPPAYADTLTKLKGANPHIVLVFGTDEAITEIFEKYEDSPPAGSNNPIWLFSDGGETSTLRAYVGNNTPLRERIRGTVPGTNNTNFVSFRSHFNSQPQFTGGSPDVFGTAGMYDITFLLAYSIVALGTEPIDGANLNTALQTYFTAAGPRVPAGTQISSTLQRMQNMQPFDFDGASGTLQFDPQTGEAPSDIQIWCLPSDTTITGSNSGIVYHADTGMLTGTLQQAVCGFTE